MPGERSLRLNIVLQRQPRATPLFLPVKVCVAVCRTLGPIDDEELRQREVHPCRQGLDSGLEFSVLYGVHHHVRGHPDTASGWCGIRKEVGRLPCSGEITEGEPLVMKTTNTATCRKCTVIVTASHLEWGVFVEEGHDENRSDGDHDH